MDVLTVKQFTLSAVALTLISSFGMGSCGVDERDSDGSESLSDDLNQTNQPQAEQIDQTSDVNQESIAETEAFGGSSFGYARFQ